MLYISRYFKLFFLCILTKLYVAEYLNNITNDNFTFLENSSGLYDQTAVKNFTFLENSSALCEQMEVNNETLCVNRQEPYEGTYSAPRNYDIDETVFDFSEIFSEQNMTNLIQFFDDNRGKSIRAVHNKTVRVDCENVYFTTLDLARLTDQLIKLECVEEVRPNAINVCIKQKASIGLDEAYGPFYPGSFTRINLFPHMVAIGFPPDESNPIEGIKYSFECGGTLLSDKYVLTAAHCFKMKQPVVLRLGVNHLKEPSDHYDLEEATDVNISRIHIHPSYRIGRRYDDIALIELENPVPLSMAIYPACLDTTNDTLDGTEFYITGWGLNDEGKQEYNLQYAKITTISRSECTEQYRKLGLKNAGISDGILESQVCAGNFTSSIMDTCKGDSGGPLQSFPDFGFAATIYGVTSFGFRCGTKPSSIFTKVSYYRYWIESIVWPQINDTIPI